MNRFIFGFQRRVWWPKWTPASRSSRIETTDMRVETPFLVWTADAGGTGQNRRQTPAPPPGEIPPGRMDEPGHGSRGDFATDCCKVIFKQCGLGPALAPGRPG